jgi:ABC-2 type transport system ATP-binding protein
LQDLTLTDDGITRLSATVDGDIDPVVKFLSRYRVVDLTVEEPDLEESVLQLYGGNAATATQEEVHHG